jgi:hypothetical protein
LYIQPASAVFWLTLMLTVPDDPFKIGNGLVQAAKAELVRSEKPRTRRIFLNMMMCP